MTALSAPIYKTPLSFGEVIPDFEMTLSMTTHQPMEGYWVLELWHKPRNELVYLLTFAKLGEALLISVVPVSYTHLDVYKRQVIKLGNVNKRPQS